MGINVTIERADMLKLKNKNKDKHINGIDFEDPKYYINRELAGCSSMREY